MNCTQFKDLIFADQDGQLSAREKAEFDRHRRDCPACSRLWSGVAEAGDHLRRAAPPMAAPDWERSWRLIAAALPRQRRPLFALPRWALATAALLAVFALGVAVARLAFFPARAPLARAAEPAFLYTAGDYFAALQPVMAEFTHNAAGGGSVTADEELVRRLLGDLYLLKLRAQKTRDAALQHLLADIELVLLEIVHCDRSDPQSARQIGSLIEEKGISLKMKVFKPSRRTSVGI